jgi:hypothetical protein
MIIDHLVMLAVGWCDLFALAAAALARQHKSQLLEQLFAPRFIFHSTEYDRRD